MAALAWLEVAQLGAGPMHLHFIAAYCQALESLRQPSGAPSAERSSGSSSGSSSTSSGSSSHSSLQRLRGKLLATTPKPTAAPSIDTDRQQQHDAHARESTQRCDEHARATADHVAEDADGNVDERTGADEPPAATRCLITRAREAAAAAAGAAEATLAFGAPAERNQTPAVPEVEEQPSSQFPSASSLSKGLLSIWQLAAANAKAERDGELDGEAEADSPDADGGLT
jgi:hypothetical protein